jgi:hypothetical protein
MRVGVDRDLNRGVSELVPHVREALALLNQMGCVKPATLYVAGEEAYPWAAAMLCPCGCATCSS